jgi:hypothetical protein
MNRTDALIWWRDISESRQNELAKLYYPSLPIAAVVTSSSKIENIWNKVENGKG